MKASLFACLALLVAAIPALAHHSFQAQYDASKPVNVTGVVTRVEWANPHAHFFVDVKDASGAVTSWDFELASPNVLKRMGWTRDIMKVGDTVSVFGAAARDGSKTANARTVNLADGRKMDAGSQADAPPDAK